MARKLKAIELRNGVTAILTNVGAPNSGPVLKLFDESGIDDGTYVPAQDICIYDVESLRDFLNEHCPKVVQ